MPTREGRNIKNQKGISVFLILSFGVAWLSWWIMYFSATTPSILKFTILNLLAAFSPAIAAIIVRCFVTKEGFNDAGLRPHFRRSIKYYLFAWLQPLFIVVVIMILITITGMETLDFSLERAFSQPEITIPRGQKELLTQLSPYLLYLPFLITALGSTFVLWGEEFGWRAYLQQRLFSNSPLEAAIATGLIWGVWHYPLILRPNSTHFPDDPLVGLIVFPVTTIFWSIILGWLQLKTRSSWTPSLAHASLNAVGSGWLSLLILGGNNWTWINSASVLAWVPLGIICAIIIKSGQLSTNDRSDG